MRQCTAGAPCAWRCGAATMLGRSLQYGLEGFGRRSRLDPLKLCGEAGVVGEMVERGVVGAEGGAERCGCRRFGVGQLGGAGSDESIVDVG